MEKFTIVDGVVLLIYFGSMASLGPLLARKGRTTEGYFLGDRAFPGWLIGFAMFATSISSITFMAYPADAYKTAYLRMLPNYTLPIAILITSRLFLPFFRRGRITSAYEYLESRFSPNIRLYAAVAFIIGQVIRISMILFLVSTLVEKVTGWPAIYSVVFGGIITSFYTITGGIQAVVWTDFIQSMVLWIGGLTCITVIVYSLGGDHGAMYGLGKIFTVAAEHGKFAYSEFMNGKSDPVPWGFDLSQKTVLLMLLLGMGNWLYEYSGNQTVVQRYCACKSTRDARVALWINCWFSVPTWLLFMFIGTALYVFYQVNPDPEAAKMLAWGEGSQPAEGILPYFVIRQLPAGMSGLVIAAVLAAAMSSISGSINGVCAVSIVDIYRRRMVTDRDDKHYVVVAKLIGLAQAVIMIVGAIILVQFQSNTLQDTATIVTALTSGGLAGLYLLGFFSIRCDGRAAGFAIVVTLVYTLWMTLSSMKLLPDALMAPIDTYYAGLIGHIVLFVVAYILGITLLKRRTPVPVNQSVWTEDGSPLD